MTFLFLLFVGSLLIGQLGGIQVAPGVYVYIHDFVLLIFLSSAWVMKKPRGFHWHVPHLAIPIALFISACVLSLIANVGKVPSDELSRGSLYLVRWILYAGLYITLVQSFVSTKMVTWAIYLFGLALGSLGFLQLAYYPYLRNLSYLGWDPYRYRLFATLLDPNFVSMILVIAFGVGVILWENKGKRIFLAIGQSVLIIALYVTYSRSGYLALLAGLVIWIILQKKWKWLAAGVIFTILVFVLPTPGGETLKPTRMISSLARLGNWQQSTKIIERSPVVGFGFNLLPYIHSPLSENTDGDVVSRTGGGIDSSLLFVWATSGIVGLTAYLWLVFSQVKLALSKMVKKSSSLVGVTIISILGALIVHSAFSNSMFYSWIMLLMWMLVAILERAV